MSTELYQKWWIKVRAGLEHVKGYDNAMRNIATVKDRPTAGKLAGGVYARYSMIVQEMDSCLDQMCQAQKSITVRKLMNAATSRLHELKDDLTKIDISEYHYIDGNLIELKLIPHSIEILHPFLMHPRPDEVEQMWKRIKNGETIYTPPPPEPEPIENPADIPPEGAAVPIKSGKSDIKVGAKQEETAPKKENAEPEDIPPPVEEKKERKKKVRPKKFHDLEVAALTPEEIEAKAKQQRVKTALILLQKHERGRACRLYYNDLYRQWFARKNPAPPGARLSMPPPEVNDNAATIIQKNWKGYAAKSFMKQRELSRRLVIGMVEPSWKSNAEFEKMEKDLEKRREIRDQNIRDYIKAHLDEKERVLRVVGPGLFEDIGDEIRENFSYWWNTLCGFVPKIPAKALAFWPFPTVDQGGSILMVRCEVTTPEEFIKEHMKQAKNKKKEKAKAKAEAEKKKKEEAERKKKEKEKLKKEALKKKLDEEKRKKRGEFEYEMIETVAHNKYLDAHDEYNLLWSEINDADNPNEKIYMDIITEEKCYQMQMEIRSQVDELMRIELDLLMESLEDYKWRMKGKKSKRKPKKKKKEKKKKGKGKKGKKDPTGNRTTEDIFQELVNNGIIHTYPKVRLEEYIGDFSYNNWEFRNLDFDPPSTLGDVRQAVLMNCILPLGVTSLAKPKSVLIAGPRQSGKHLLANAIFYESKCVLFDLSMKVLAGKYPGKKGMVMLVHLINKMSRLLQPSIIFVDGAETPFYKKVPKPEKEFDPKRLGKQLFKKIVKPITVDDRVLVLGITGQPFAAKASGLKKAYQRVILIPRTDYGSVFLYWRQQLMPYHGVDRNFDVSSITKATVTYPLSEISRAVKTVLVANRLIQLKYKPLHQAELLAVLIYGPGPVIDKEYAKFTKWFKSTALGKERFKYMAIAAKKREKENKAKA